MAGKQYVVSIKTRRYSGEVLDLNFGFSVPAWRFWGQKRWVEARARRAWRRLSRRFAILSVTVHERSEFERNVRSKL